MWDIYKVPESYKKFPEIKRDEVLKFQEWIQAQPHMPDMPEHEALLFYYASNCSMEFAKQVLDTYLTCRTHIDEFFGDTDVERADFKRAMRTIAVCPLPETTPEGYGVVMVKLVDTNASYFNFAHTIKLILLTMDIWIQETGVLPGLLFVIDLKGVQLGHVARIGPLLMKKFLFFLQEAIPIRMRGLHFINIVPFMDKILALMTPFIKKDLQNVLYVHTSQEDFYRHVPQQLLPKENGGDLMESKDLKEVYYDTLRRSRNDILTFERNHLIDEARRPGKAKTVSDLFGIEGNFKRLDID